MRKRQTRHKELKRNRKMTEFKKFAKELLERAVTDDMQFFLASRGMSISRNHNGTNLEIRFFYITIEKVIVQINTYKAGDCHHDTTLFQETRDKLPTTDETLVLMQKYGFYEGTGL